MKVVRTGLKNTSSASLRAPVRLWAGSPPLTAGSGAWLGTLCVWRYCVSDWGAKPHADSFVRQSLSHNDLNLGIFEIASSIKLTSWLRITRGLNPVNSDLPAIVDRVLLRPVGFGRAGPGRSLGERVLQTVDVSQSEGRCPGGQGGWGKARRSGITPARCLPGCGRPFWQHTWLDRPG